MPVQPKRITPALKVLLAATFIAEPDTNRSQVARNTGISRQHLYTITKLAQRALAATFDPHQHNPDLESFSISVTPERIKRTILCARAACGATESSLQALLIEAFKLRMSQELIRQVCLEGYQRSFQYQQSISLASVERACFDEMYRWSKCVITGVDADTYYIFLAEKQPGPRKKVFHTVFSRLKQQRSLAPAQVNIDGYSALDTSIEAVWPEAQVRIDINHLRRQLEHVRSQFDNRAYRAIDKADEVRHNKGLKQYQQRMDKERDALNLAEHVTDLVNQAHAALCLFDPDSGELNQLETSQAKLKTLSKQFDALGTMYAKATASKLRGNGQQIVAGRAGLLEAMERVAKEHKISYEYVLMAGWVWQLHKALQAVKWKASQEKLEKQLVEGYSKLRCVVVGHEELLKVVFEALSNVLTASSPVEWGNGRIGQVVAPQKRLLSGWLALRVTYLNLHRFEHGKRKGYSPHELLTGERVDDWLARIGYKPRTEGVRTYKSLGWSKLVEPFEPTWRTHWVGNQPLVSDIESAQQPLEAAA